MEKITGYFDRVFEACSAIDIKENETLIDILEQAFHQSRRIFIFGNGGSGATASHFCEDLGKGTLNGCNDSKRFRVMSLTDNVAYILAWANDEGYDTIFEQQLRNLAEKGDVAIGISGSGNSTNVLKAIEYANKIGMVTVGMTGFNGGRLRKLAQYSVHVPVDDMGIAEAIHGIITHWVVTHLKERINGK